eukprot:s2727_g4.t1
MSLVGLFYQERVWYRSGLVLVSVSILSRLILFVALCRSRWDEQRFILKVMNKFLFVAMLGWLFLLPAFLWANLGVIASSRLWLLIADCCLLSMLLFSFLGIRGTAKLPLGLMLLQIFFRRGASMLNALEVCARSNTTWGRSGSWSTDSTDSTDSGDVS